MKLFIYVVLLEIGMFLIFYIYLFIYLFIYQVTSYHKKNAASSRSITKASKHAIPLKLTHKLAESKRYLVTW